VRGLSPFAQVQHAVTHGMAAAFALAALLDVCSLLVIITLIRARRLRPAPVPDPAESREALAS
jgi:uncharacterized membrane protein